MCSAGVEEEECWNAYGWVVCVWAPLRRWGGLVWEQLCGTEEKLNRSRAYIKMNTCKVGSPRSM